MRLAKISLCGFKSFADKTDVTFDEPMVGIVGPNGCGKSNIVDAIKWVLGAQSAKSLRGGAMLDVIFNGSATRKPSGLASVTLTFDNHRREDDGRDLPLDFDQISVTRQLYRDGSSEYLINKQRCRLRDVKELFMDTGVGTDAYSIIEQGKVDLLLQANPQDRREIFEEAAGISKFKARKKDAIRRLERIEQNMALTRQRLGDIERRLRSVKIQAGRARTYQELSSRLRELRLSYCLAEYHKIQTRLQVLDEQIEQSEADRQAAARSLHDHEQRLADAQIERQSILSQQKHVEHERIQKQACREQAHQREQFARTTLDEVQQQIDRDERRRQELVDRNQQLGKELQEQSDLVSQLTSAEAQAQQRLEAAQNQHRQLQHELNEKRNLLEDEKAGIVGLMRRAAQLHNQINSIDAFEKSLLSSGEKLGQRQIELADELERLLTGRDDAIEKQDEAKQIIDAQQAQLDNMTAQGTKLDGQQRELAGRLGAAKEQRSGLDSRRAVLQEMQDNQEGVADAVKAVMARKAAAATEGQPDGGTFGFVRGLVADLFETDVEHAPLVEAALGEYQQALVIDRLDQICSSNGGSEAIKALGGRVSFLAIDQCRLGANPGSRLSVEPRPVPVIDMAHFPDWAGPVAWKLLGQTLLVSNLPAARDLQARLPAGYRFVTESGELLDDSGRVTAGPTTEAGVTGLIARRSELARLNQQIVNLDDQIASDQQSLAQLSDRVAHIETVAQELRQSIFEANTVRIELASKIENLQGQIQRLEREQPVLAAETEQIHRQLRDADQERKTHQQVAAQIQEHSSARQQAIAALEVDIAQQSERVESEREAVTSIRIELGQVAEQLAAAQHQARQIEIARDDMDRQRGLVQDQLTHHRARIKQLHDNAEQAQRQAAQALAELDQLEAKLGDICNRLAVTEAEIEQLQDQFARRRETVAQADQMLHHLQVEQREQQVKGEAVVQRASEQLNLNLVQAYEQVSTEHVAAADGQRHEIDWEAVESEIDELRTKLQHLGSVNLDAINEQEDIEKQHAELAGQVKDIEDAKVQLEQLIKQINIDSRKRFEKTFEQIRENFAGQAGMFRRLFGGGHADIILQPDESGQVDVLESGIEIIARPPGMKPRVISLFSGGQKTLTAVALLLSIFRTRPSPFCVLDEVDAALDDANVERFTQVIQSFFDRSHFVVITHNKQTMGVCDVLYGITMQERGVSQRVAVKFEHVGPDGKISKDAIEAQEREEKTATDLPRRDVVESGTSEEPHFKEQAQAVAVADEPDNGKGNGKDTGKDNGKGNGSSRRSSRRQRLAEMLEGTQPVEVENI